MNVRDIHPAIRRLVIWVARPLLRVLRATERDLEADSKAALISQMQSFGVNSRIGSDVTITEPKAVVIGENVHIGDGCYIESVGGLRIQDNSHISPRVTICCSDHVYGGEEALPFGKNREWREVIIEQNVWIGMNVSILPGVTIGEGAIVGMGAVVAKDVPPRTVVVGQGLRPVSERDLDNYARQKRRRNFGGVNGRTLTFISKSEEPIEARDICFVVGTGRCGSQTIVSFLNQHPSANAAHEPRLQMIPWSTLYEYGRVTRETLRRDLITLFELSLSDLEGNVRVESDQKYFNLIELLSDIFPRAKFVWMIRDARDFVSSAVGRGWYASDAHPVYDKIPHYYHEFRIQGVLTGSVDAIEWGQMSPHARNCWYWGYVNSRIEKQFLGLDKQRQYFLRLEDFSEKSSDLLKFLGLRADPLPVPKSNRAFYRKKSSSRWDIEEWQAFEKWCGPLMRRYYLDVAAPDFMREKGTLELQPKVAHRRFENG